MKAQVQDDIDRVTEYLPRQREYTPDEIKGFSHKVDGGYIFAPPGEKPSFHATTEKPEKEPGLTRDDKLLEQATANAMKEEGWEKRTPQEQQRAVRRHLQILRNEDLPVDQGASSEGLLSRWARGIDPRGVGSTLLGPAGMAVDGVRDLYDWWNGGSSSAAPQTPQDKANAINAIKDPKARQKAWDSLTNTEKEELAFLVNP
jgi:hypothetical protein